MAQSPAKADSRSQSSFEFAREFLMPLAGTLVPPILSLAFGTYGWLKGIPELKNWGMFDVLQLSAVLFLGLIMVYSFIVLSHKISTYIKILSVLQNTETFVRGDFKHYYTGAGMDTPKTVFMEILESDPMGDFWKLYIETRFDEHRLNRLLGSFDSRGKFFVSPAQARLISDYFNDIVDDVEDLNMLLTIYSNANRELVVPDRVHAMADKMSSRTQIISSKLADARAALTVLVRDLG